MNAKKRVLFGLAVGVVLALCGTLVFRFASRSPAHMREDDALDPAQQIAVVGGQPAFPLSGNRVVLFLTPACPHCREEIATLSVIRSRHPEWQLGWIAVSLSKAGPTNRYLSGKGWRIYFDPGRKALLSLGISRVPLLLLINGANQLLYRRAGTCGTAEDERALTEFCRGQEIAPAVACQ